MSPLECLFLYQLQTTISLREKIKAKKTRIQDVSESVQTARLCLPVRRAFVPSVTSASASVIRKFRKIMARTITQVGVHRLRSNKNDNSKKSTQLSQFFEHL